MSDVGDDVEGALEEMGYEIVDNGVMELPSSKPACFDLVGDTKLAPEAFEAALDEHDFGTLTPMVGENDDDEFYCYVDVVTDHYKKVNVRVWNDSVRVFPNEDLPDKYELARILHAVEEAFGGEVEHKPAE